jgi:hypothetical protein
MKLSRVGLGTAILASMLACSNDTDTTTGPDPIPQQRANFTVQVANQRLVANDTNPNKAYFVTAEVTVTETAGVGGAIDYCRLSAQGPGGAAEVAEITGDMLVSQAGTNRIAPNTSWTYNVWWEWNLEQIRSQQIAVQLTDDNGNVHEVVIPS